MMKGEDAITTQSIRGCHHHNQTTSRGREGGREGGRELHPPHHHLTYALLHTDTALEVRRQMVLRVAVSLQNGCSL